MNFMGIDIGTTSVKTAVFNETLEQILSLTADYTLDSHGDIVEFDGEKYWEIVKGEIEKVKRELSIEALAVDTQCETLILTDDDGNPVRPAIVWLDNRATEEAEIITAQFGHKKVYEYIVDCINESHMPIASHLFDIIDSGEAAMIIESVDTVKVESQSSFFTQSVKKLRVSYADKELKRTIAELNGETDPQRKEELKERIKLYTQLRR